MLFSGPQLKLRFRFSPINCRWRNYATASRNIWTDMNLKDENREENFMLQLKLTSVLNYVFDRNCCYCQRLAEKMYCLRICKDVLTRLHTECETRLSLKRFISMPINPPNRMSSNCSLQCQRRYQAPCH